MKQMCEIDIPNGYEFVDFRKVTYEETYISQYNSILEWIYSYPSDGYYLIIRKSFTFPDWVANGVTIYNVHNNWYLKDKDGYCVHLDTLNRHILEPIIPPSDTSRTYTKE